MTANDIYTVAGHSNGTAGISANGTVNTSTFLNNPTGIVLNNGAQMYISDGFSNRIAEIAHTTHSEFGISMTANDLYDVAGSASGASGYSGNGGAATSALMGSINGQIAWASAGMYVADTDNNEVRLVNATTDVITDFAGGAGTFAQEGDGGTAVDAGLSSPLGVASDSHGDVFIADQFNNQVYEVPAASGSQYGISMTAGHIYTLAGSTAGTSGFSGDGGLATSSLLESPDGVAVDAAGNVYIGDGDNGRVQEIAATTHAQWGTAMTRNDVYTVAGSATGSAGSSGDGGPATAALLDFPGQLAIDSSGNLYIADSGNSKIREVERNAILKKANRFRLVPACAGVVLAVFGAAACGSARPVVDRAQAGAMLPAINAYLSGHAVQLMPGSLSPRLKPRVFCDAGIIEIRPAGARWSVGMAVNCGEFARHGATLLEGTSGYPGIGEIATLSVRHGNYRVLSLQVGPPYSDRAWVDSHFSSGAAAWVLGAHPPTAPDPIWQARRAFGFPPGTRAVQPEP